jgi:hypothetical protein
LIFFEKKTQGMANCHVQVTPHQLISMCGCCN